MNYPVYEQDWVVTGSSPEEMIKRGFTQVGKDFPVFLHPKTKEEHALARTERKVSGGHTGFRCHFSPEVSLEEDLYRRDLTVNAIAIDQDKNVIDPYNGRKDLEKKVLRHVSSAFVEDPLRVLRVARFAARYHHLGFTIANETLELMKAISASGELQNLSSERVWKELVRAFGETSPHIFIETLRSCGALEKLLPEVDILFGIPQPEEHHPEIDTGAHLLLALKQAGELSRDPAICFAILTHDLGKGLTDQSQWPQHIGHESKGVAIISQLARRIKVPTHFSALAKHVCEYHTNCHRALELTPKKIVALLKKCDAFRNPDRFEQFLTACQADAQGRLGFTKKNYPQANYLRNALMKIKNINVKNLIHQDDTGEQIAEKLHQERVRLTKQYISEQKNN